MATGICHTDINAHAGHSLPAQTPIVLRRAAAGVVERVGTGVAGSGPTTMSPCPTARTVVCPNCRTGRPAYCREATLVAFGGRRVDGSSPLSRQGERTGGMFLGQASLATSAVAPVRSAGRWPAG
ncbi:alcohol dehydrogenase catalytic domain-containing protein [Streptomyces sp. NPDC002623]